jgi:hypothetical protein
VDISLFVIYGNVLVSWKNKIIVSRYIKKKFNTRRLVLKAISSTTIDRFMLCQRKYIHAMKSHRQTTK